MKLYDGRGKRFKNLVDPKVIMKENSLKITSVVPKESRAKWYAIWIRGSLEFLLGMGLLIVLSNVVHYFVYQEHYFQDQNLRTIAFVMSRFIAYAFLFGWICVFVDRKKTWKSTVVAIHTLARNGFCPNCGYIIRGTPEDSDGCVPCSECGHAWHVEVAEA